MVCVFIERATLEHFLAIWRPLVLDPSYALSQVLPELLLIKTHVQCHYALVWCPHNQGSPSSPNFILAFKMNHLQTE